MIKMQQQLLTLLEQIHKPFVQRLIALIIAGLIALLLGGALLLSGHGAVVTHLRWQVGSASEGVVIEWPLSTHYSPPVARGWLLLRSYPGSGVQKSTW